MSTYIGSALPLELKRDARYSINGDQYRKQWKCLTSGVDAFIVGLKAAGYTEIDAVGVENTPFHIVTAEISATTGPTDVLATVWSIAFNEINRSIWLHPTVMDEMAGATNDQKFLFRADVEAYYAGNRTYQDTDGSDHEITLAQQRILAVAWGADGAVIDALFNSLGNGTDSYLVSLPVLRGRMILTEGTSLEPVFENVGAMFTNATLLSTETTLPDNIADAISAEFTGGYWLRKAPTAEQQDDGRWVYGTEYWYAETATPDPLIYPTVL